MSSCTYARPVDPNVSIAKKSPSSILVWSPPRTMGTVLPAWIWYLPIECPFRLRMGLTVARAGGRAEG
jgi:hypothetical protein